MLTREARDDLRYKLGDSVLRALSALEIVFGWGAGFFPEHVWHDSCLQTRSCVFYDAAIKCVEEVTD